MRNNNQTAVRRLSVRSLKANRTRNIVAVVAIVLTTFMITAVFSIGLSFAKNLSVMNTRLNGSRASIFLNNPTDGQTEAVKDLDGIRAVGREINIGSATVVTPEGKEARVSLLNCDETGWTENILPALGDVKGSYPDEKDEIMLSRSAFGYLGINTPQIGQRITLECRISKAVSTEIFRLSGWFTSYTQTSSTSLAMLSDAFCADKGLTLEDDGKLAVSAQKRKWSTVYDGLKDLKGDSQELSSVFDPDTETSESTVMTAAAIVMIALFIVFSGYLLIYNIMYISVTKDIHFYGLLKTVGTSPKQIRTLVRRQGLLLSAVGIPLGLLLGFVTSFGIVPLAMSMFTADSVNSAMPSDISFNPLIFAGTALFAQLTVIVSCRKPARIAASVSPVEAVKYTGVTSSVKKKSSRSTSGGKLYRMALRNVFREKKRALLVFSSLFMGMLTFLSVVGFFSSLDVNNYIDSYYPDDFVYQSIPPLDEEKFDAAFMRSVEDMDGIESEEIVRSEYCTLPFDEQALTPALRSVYNRYFTAEEGNFENYLNTIRNMAEKGEFGTRVYSVDVKYVEEYNKTHDDKVDVQAFRKGEICLLGYDDYGEITGKTLEVTSKTTGKKENIRVAGVLGNDSSCDYAKYSYTVGMIQAVFVSEEFINRLNPDAFVNYIMLNVNADAEPSVLRQLTALNKTVTNNTYVFEARSEVAASFTSTMKTMKVLTSGISALLILIGIINFINVMMTGVNARRRELAVMESIGMEKRQIGRMLILEGGYYAFITATLILTVGSSILYFIGQAVPGIADYAVFRYPVSEVVGLIAATFVICLVVPPLVFRISSKQSVTERLHTADE